jgi:predicted site-specific integrase-resolvase
MKTREETTKTEVVQMLNMTRACEIWGVTKWHVYDLIKAGRIKPITNAGKGFKFLATDYKQRQNSPRIVLSEFPSGLYRKPA